MIQSKVYDCRKKLDVERQPDFADMIDQLDNQLRDISNSSKNCHPYTPGNSAHKNFLSLSRNFLQDDSAFIKASTYTKYLYRLSAFRAILNSNSRKNNRNPLHEHAKLLADVGKTPKWFELSKYIDGYLTNDKGTLWWTAFDLSSVDPPHEGALRIGMPLNWTHRASVLLRIRADQVADYSGLRVPTSLDGFDSPVFLSSKFAAGLRPKEGLTIDLRETKNLQEGVSEYVSDPIEARHIEFIPINLDRRVMELQYGSSYKLDDWSDLWSRLLGFYNSRRK